MPVKMFMNCGLPDQPRARAVFALPHFGGQLRQSSHLQRVGSRCGPFRSKTSRRIRSNIVKGPSALWHGSTQFVRVHAPGGAGSVCRTCLVLHRYHADRRQAASLGINPASAVQPSGLIVGGPAA